MEFELKTGPQGHIYFPKKIREIFGEKILLLPNDSAGAIYSANADPARVVASLEVIIAHLRLQIDAHALAPTSSKTPRRPE